MLRLYLYARVRVLMRKLHTGPRVQRAPGLPCALQFLKGKVKSKPRAQRVARMPPHIPPSSSALCAIAHWAGRSSIPETAVTEPRSRSVLDTPPSRSMTALAAHDLDDQATAGSMNTPAGDHPFREIPGEGQQSGVTMRLFEMQMIRQQSDYFFTCPPWLKCNDLISTYDQPKD
jgi:hypothetical protein